MGSSAWREVFRSLTGSTDNVVPETSKEHGVSHAVAAKLQTGYKTSCDSHSVDARCLVHVTLPHRFCFLHVSRSESELSEPYQGVDGPGQPALAAAGIGCLSVYSPLAYLDPVN